MALDYQQLAQVYRPTSIETLLIGEAPPPNGTKYFYQPEDSIRKGSLPETIFLHYFGKRPNNKHEYLMFLERLKRSGIFLIDIADEPIKIRDKTYKGWINPNGIARLISEIPQLQPKILKLKPKQVIVLLARNKYKKVLKEYLPTETKFTSWKKFRESRDLLADNR